MRCCKAFFLVTGLASCAPLAREPCPARAHGTQRARTSPPDDAALIERAAGAAEANADAKDGDSDELHRAVDAWLAAAKGGDPPTLQAKSTAECWTRECRTFARQAGKKFRAELREAPRRHERHAVAVADVLCGGDRRCDLVDPLFDLEPSLRWRVADATEDRARAEVWIAPAR